MKTITMTLFNRPQYTKRVIDALSQCDGIQKYHLLIFIDHGGNPDVIRLANDIKFTSKEVVVHTRRFGCDNNIHSALSAGFKKSDYNIHIEDDICPGKDMLKYFEFCDYRYRHDLTVFTICAYHKARNDGEHQKYYYDKVFRNPWFTPWGWATWQDRWEEMNRQWIFNIGYDIHVHNNIRRDRFEIRPYSARTQNIGEFNGAHATPEIFLRDHYNEFWVNSVDYRAENFIEV